MPDPSSSVAYVFGYASLVALPEQLAVEDAEHEPLPGWLRGFRRYWGAAMNNWEGGDAVKHFLDRETGERPRIRVAYLDVEPSEGSTVNGIAIPVDAERLATLDAREINYSRVDVTAAFDRPLAGRVFTYVGLGAARERCREGVAEGNAYVSRDYLAGVRRAFEQLAPDALAEFDRATDPLPFPERDLRMVLPGRAGT
ncbi:MAG TPA: gamma-glutamylcyclotransferase family protein [Solirubrobacterales bacterium]|nr:gamma-glutamylcyclotransferase family protein [Solirubrobacterales bacterium]